MTTWRQLHNRFHRVVCDYRKKKKRLSSDQIDQFESLVFQLDEAFGHRQKARAEGLVSHLENFLFPFLKKGMVRKMIELMLTLSIALLLAIVFRHCYAELYVIPSGSMRFTLREQERVLVSKLPFGINVPLTPRHLFFSPDRLFRTNLVTFTAEDLPIKENRADFFFLPGYKRFVKRCMGKAGDRLYFYGGHIYGIDRQGRDLTELREDDPVRDLEYLPSSYTSQPRSDAHFGLHHFAFVRLLSKEEGKAEFPFEAKKWRDAAAFLELHYWPKSPSFMQFTLFPLSEDHLQQIWETLTTERFLVQSGKVFSWSHGTPNEPSFYLSCEEGCYEFDQGKAYKIGFGGIARELDRSHPIYTHTFPLLQRWFNRGIVFSSDDHFLTRRYVYFRQGDLFLFRRPLVQKNDLFMKQFIAWEKEKAQRQRGYVPFVDEGPPLLADGSIDRKKIETEGLLVPDGHYYCLGDNHANSNDSRVFGFVPENNIRGVPFLRIWPPNRWGTFEQPATPWAFFSVTVLGIVLIAGGAMMIYCPWRRRKLSPGRLFNRMMKR